MSDLDKKDKLDAETFEKLVTAIPQGERESFDKPANILVSLLNKGITFFLKKYNL